MKYYVISIVAYVATCMAIGYWLSCVLCSCSNTDSDNHDSNPTPYTVEFPGGSCIGILALESFSPYYNSMTLTCTDGRKYYNLSNYRIIKE